MNKQSNVSSCKEVSSICDSITSNKNIKELDMDKQTSFNYVDVPVFTVSKKGKLINSGETLQMYGIATGYDHPLYVRIVMAQKDTVSKDMIMIKIEKTQRLVSMLSNGLSKLCPTHSGRIRRTTIKGESVVAAELLFARNGYTSKYTSLDVARQCTTNFHENERSEVMGIANVAIVSGKSYFACKYDGYSIAKASAFPKVTTPILKINLWEDRKTCLTDPKNYLKGIMEFVSDKEFAKLCRFHRITGEDINVLAPACSIKYGNDSTHIMNAELVKILDPITSMHATLGVQAFSRVPLTEWAENIAYQTWKDATNNIFTALEDKSGKAVIGILNSVMKEFNSKYEASEIIDDDMVITFKQPGKKTVIVTLHDAGRGKPLKD